MNIDKNKLEGLLVKLKFGEGKAFEKIYNLTRESAYFTAYKILGNRFDAENVLQDSYGAVLASVNEIRNADELLEKLYCSVAENSREMLELYKHPLFALDYSGEPEENDEVQESEFVPDKDGSEKELASRLSSLTDGLNPDERAAFILCTHCGLSAEKAAQALGTDENAVRLCRASAEKEIGKEAEKLGIGAAGLISAMKWAMDNSCSTEAVDFISSGASDSVLAAVASMADTPVRAPEPAPKKEEKKPEPEKPEPVEGAADYFDKISVENNRATLWKAVAGILAAVCIAVAAAYVKTNGLPWKKTEELPNTVPPDKVTDEYTGETSFDSLGTKEYITGTYYFDVGEDEEEESTEEVSRSTLEHTQETMTEPVTEITEETETATTAKPTTTAKTTKASTAQRERTSRERTTRERTSREFGTKTTTAAATESVTETTTETTTVTTTTAPEKKATVILRIQKNGKLLDTVTVPVAAGTPFTRNDVIAAVNSAGYEAIGSDITGTKLPLTPSANQTYNMTVKLFK